MIGFARRGALRTLLVPRQLPRRRGRAPDEHLRDEQVAGPGARAGAPHVRVEEEGRVHRAAGAPAGRARRQRPAPAQRDRQVPTGGPAAHAAHNGYADGRRLPGARRRLLQRQRRPPRVRRSRRVVLQVPPHPAGHLGRTAQELGPAAHRPGAQVRKVSLTAHPVEVLSKNKRSRFVTSRCPEGFVLAALHSPKYAFMYKPHLGIMTKANPLPFTFAADS